MTIEDKPKRTGFEIAVIGMAGRFPGAKNLNEFWNNLEIGVEPISFFSDEEIKKNNNSPQPVNNPNYVRSNGSMLENKEYFDASFFGYTPREAEIMDPQLRIFHECCWHALEDAGYNPGSYEGFIGIYAGATSNFDWNVRCQLTGKSSNLGQFAASQLTDKDYLVTRIAYNFDLKGPAVVVQTACSTSLAAIHTACRSLLTAECDIALAGGVTILSQNSIGYIYQEGMINSPDGHCRAFDARAKGTVGGEGAGVVVLKRLKQALAAGDNIHALILGSASNNDGRQKPGFTAPGIDAQADVITRVLHITRVKPESITYIETHGTATPLGDPIEIEALKQAFDTDKKNFCAIGSVKSNIGHLDNAAGVAAFIKTVLALKNRSIPPSLHFESPNPQIDFDNSPFYVNTTCREWKNDNHPLRAGVSSFGIGGTNFHVVLEEAPEGTGGLAPLSDMQPLNRQHQLIILSAKTNTALKKIAHNLVGHLEKNPALNLADAAYTLQVGRKSFNHRKMLVCANRDEAISKLTNISKGGEITKIPEEEKPVVFMFPGQGAQYVDMGRGLYQVEPLFRQEMHRCFEILRPIMQYDIKEILYPSLSAPSATSAVNKKSPDINQTEIAQPIIFIIEYALAQLLMKWGIAPIAMIGHSIGEYTAACLSGVFSLEDALKLVYVRGKLMEKMPAGDMLSVELPEKELTPLLNPNISLAAVNSPSHCVVSGTHENIEKFSGLLKEKGHKYRLLHTSHAFHSDMMEPILKEFEEHVKQMKLQPPVIPYISNLTGEAITASEAMSPGYWCKHLRRTVQFGKGIQVLLEENNNAIFIEVGPGNVLSSFMRKFEDQQRHSTLNVIRHPRENAADDYYLLNKLGQLWLNGVNINWEKFYTGEKRQRISLPTYPFEGLPYWIEGDPSLMAGDMLTARSADKKTDMADWFYIPSWKRSMIPMAIDQLNEGFSKRSCWLVFSDEIGLASHLVKRLKQQEQETIIVKPGNIFSKLSDREYAVNPGQNHHYNTILNELRKIGKIPERIIHLWSVTACDINIKDPGQRYDKIQALGFYSLMYLVQAIGKQNYKHHVQIAVITNGMHWVTGDEALCPEQATILGAVKVIPLEYSHIRCCSIDINLRPTENRRHTALVDQLLLELLNQFTEPILAYRNNTRWIQVVEPVPLENRGHIPSRLKKGGIYLVTGGLGGIGYSIAHHLAKSVQAKLVLTGRSEFPSRQQWDHWLTTHGENDKVSRNIQKIQELEHLGAQVLVCSADVADSQQMHQVITLAEKQLGPVNGVFHSAGLPDGGVIPLRTKETTEKILAPKVKGTLILNDLLEHTKLDFFVNCSSLNSITGVLGQLGYCAANSFQDAFSYYKTYKEGIFTVSINWDTWAEVGMGVEAVNQLLKDEVIKKPEGQFLLKHAILPSEGIKVFNRIMEYAFPQVIVSTRDITILRESLDVLPGTPGPDEELQMKPSPGQLYPRPELSTEYASPNTQFEQQYANILQQYLGFEKIGIHDNLFEFGVGSLEMIHINEKIKKVLKKDIPLAVMFEFPTIHSMEKYLSNEEVGETFVEESNPAEEEQLMYDTINTLSEED
ncbi:MAG: SDR family NAD(P)-dependent oxidoreductase [Candidatus Aminicenantes bacterium]|nr:MAG: SDR family NAD(P)-dependent oxidoreductase [Candidatus Aminicenantes bacterium]